MFFLQLRKGLFVCSWGNRSRELQSKVVVLLCPEEMLPVLSAFNPLISEALARHHKSLRAPETRGIWRHEVKSTLPLPCRMTLEQAKAHSWASVSSCAQRDNSDHSFLRTERTCDFSLKIAKRKACMRLIKRTQDNERARWRQVTVIQEARLSRAVSASAYVSV